MNQREGINFLLKVSGQKSIVLITTYLLLLTSSTGQFRTYGTDRNTWCPIATHIKCLAALSQKSFLEIERNTTAEMEQS